MAGPLPADDPLSWLQEYYLSLCDGDWEHSYGFAIDNIDNPGWSLKFDLAETNLEGAVLGMQTVERSENDWIFYSVKEKVFTAFCGPKNLSEALAIFRWWVESQAKG